MRVRINTDSMRRELNKLRGLKTAVRRVMLVPKMAASIEEWEAVAEPQQRALLDWSMTEHSGAEVREPGPVMTADQERVFAHHMETMRRRGKPMAEEQRAAQAYAKATGIYRWLVRRIRAA